MAQLSKGVQPKKTYERITPLRHAAHMLASSTWNRQWLQWQTIRSIVTSTRARYFNLFELVEKGQSGAQAIHRRMTALANQMSHLGFEPDSFEIYILDVDLFETYVVTGDKVRSYTQAVIRIDKMIKRARKLSDGTTSIQWLLDGVGDEFTRFVREGWRVKASLRTVSSDDAKIRGMEMITLKVIGANEK